MSLGFLSPAASLAPPARGPLAEAATAAGARIEVRAGWELAVSFGDPATERAACAETVGFADLSHLTKLELQAAPALLSEPLGESALGTARRGEGGSWSCPVAPTLRLELHLEPDVVERRRQALEPAGVRVCDVTASLGAISVRGPRATEMIARFSAIDARPRALPVGGFRPGSIARTPGYLLREGQDAFLLLFGAAYGAYMWEVVADAAAALGGRPVGIDALPAVEVRPAHA